MSSVDVVVPCFNYSRYLKFSVDTVLSQRDVDVRVLIIDDLSTDDTETVGKRLAAQDPRVTFRRHEVNAGLIGTANEGVLEWATAPYTLLLSADDALTPGALARACHVLDAHPEAGMVYGLSRILGAEDVSGDVSDVAVPTYQILSGPRFLEHSCRFGNQVPSPAAVVRTSLQQRTGGYCPKMRHTSDMEMWMRIATTCSIGVIQEEQAYYRWHGGNMTSQYASGKLSDGRERAMTCSYVYDTWGGANIPGFTRWIADMKTALVKNACWLGGMAFERGDTAEGRACLDFAREIEPAVWRTHYWWRCQAKRVAGEALLKRVRGILGARGQVVEPTRPDPLQAGQAYGWWPEAG